MTFSFACRQCGHDNHAELGWAGRTIHCAGCGGKLAVPAPHEPAGGDGGALVSLDSLRFTCPGCGRKYTTKPDLAGKKIRCGGCGGGVRVPGVAAAGAASGVALSPSHSALKVFADAPASRSGVRAPIDPAIDLDTLAAAAGVKASARKAKAGGEVVESVLPSRTEAMEELEKSLAEKAAADEERKKKQEKKKAKTKKKRSSGGLEPKEVANIIGVSVLTAVVLGGLTYSAPPLRFPIGGLLLCVGGLTYVFGTYGFAHAAREEGAVYSLMCKFVPYYKWYFLYSRWEMMKGHFAFYAVGLTLLSTGLLMVKESPDFKNRKAVMEQRRVVDGGPVMPIQPPPGFPAAIPPVAHEED